MHVAAGAVAAAGAAHHRYHHRTHANDIALLRTTSPITRGRPIALPTSNARPSGTAAVATGWGTTSEGGRRSSDLLATTLDVLPESSCARTYSANYRSDVMLCAGHMPGGRDTCQGDSGGPLAQSGVLIGITSFGRGCARSNTPGVYTRVSHFVDWIRCHTQPLQQQGPASQGRRCARSSSSTLDFLSPAVNLIPVAG